jgi:predicted transcriptional regulator
VRQKDDDIEEILKICRTLGNRVALAAILSIMADSKSVADIAVQNKTPMSSTYKAIKALEKAGLVSVDKVVIDSGGKRIALYRSKIKLLHLTLDNGRAELQIDKR